MPETQSQPFLKHVAQSLFEQYESMELSNLLIVLPSRRACRYFKYYLATCSEKPLLSPEVLSMADFMRKQSKLASVDSISLLFKLYQVYKRFDKTPDHNLEKFAPLGMAMLKDFNLIDMNLTPEKAGELFEYLEESKAIERWAEELGSDREFKKTASLDQYFMFWEALRQTYLHFRNELLQESKAYHGLAFRWVFEHLDEIIPKLPFEQIIFAGFSQLTHVEFQVMQKLVEEQKARIFWDTDKYYTEGNIQEAGEYFRIFRKHYIADHPDFHNVQIGSFEQHIEIVKTGEPITQVKFLAAELKKAVSEGNISADSINKIGILLPDETLLVPLLHSIPDVELEGKSLAELTNITMGLSFQQSNLFHWLELWFRLQLNARQEGTMEIAFYHQDILKLLSHPFAGISGETRKAAQAVGQWLRSENKVYASPEELILKASSEPFFALIFSPWKEDFTQAIQQFLAFCKLIAEQLDAEEQQMERFYLQEFYKAVQRLHDVLSVSPEKITLKTFRQFLFEILRSISIPFTGEPLGPVQIMGMLESRSLDFEQVFVLSCNDGILPKRKRPDSLIPFDLRSRFNLPTYRENDASFAYTFYRLFHKAKKVTLIYSDPAIKPENGGMSRFLYQIKEEFSAFPKIKLTEKTIGLKVSVQQLDGPVIEKDDFTLNLIRERLEGGKSPSAISSYIRNPVEFYFDHILKLKEEELIEENLDAHTLGTLIHDTLELLLKPKDKLSHRDWLAEDFDPFFKEGFLLETILKVGATSPEIKHMNLTKGKNYLLTKIAEKQIGVFLRKEQKTSPFRIVLAEDFLNHTIELNLSDGSTLNFKLGGKADRIDIIGNQLRVVDYKTGSFQKPHLKAESWEELFQKPEKGKIIQLMLYKYLLLKNLHSEAIAPKIPSEWRLEQMEIKSGFFFFQSLSSGFVEYTLKDEPAEPNEFFTYVENFIRHWVEDLLNPAQPFTSEQSAFMGVEE